MIPDEFVARFENVTGRDGNGGWHWNMQGVFRILYRLPGLLEADPAAPVFVAEGEKDVDCLASLGLIATCNVGGAGRAVPHPRRRCLRHDSY